MSTRLVKPKISLTFIHRPKGEVSWPHIDFDYEKRKKELSEKFKDSCPNIDFVPYSACTNKEAEDLVNRSNEFDGFVLYLIGQTTVVPALILKSGKPTVLTTDLYGGQGSFLLNRSWTRDAGLPVVGLSTSNLEDVVNATKLFRVKKRVSESKIILITEKDDPAFKRDSHPMYRGLFETTEYGSSGKTYDIPGQIDKVKKIFGTEVIRMTFEELFEYYESAQVEEAEIVADRWINEALRVVEPTRDDIVKSARMYLGIKKAMLEREADVITIDCYRQFHKMPAYPCMTFFQLNNEGLTGVCEADLHSSIVQLILRYLTEEITGMPRPGYVNDPVIDLANGWIIYAHCTATNRVFGPESPGNPYIIRTHAESRSGVATQSLMPTGKIVTSMQMHFTGESPVMVLHQGKTIAKVDAEEGCRTKLVTEANVEKIMENWNKGVEWVYPANWHRVTVYGDWKKQLTDLATLMGIKVINEDEA